MLGTRRRLLPSSVAGSSAGGSTTAYGVVSVKTPLGIRQAHREFAGGARRQRGAHGETCAAATEIRRAHEADARERRIDHHEARVFIYAYAFSYKRDVAVGGVGFHPRDAAATALERKRLIAACDAQERRMRQRRQRIYRDVRCALGRAARRRHCTVSRPAFRPGFVPGRKLLDQLGEAAAQP